jgi:hypothetical protein
MWFGSLFQETPARATMAYLRAVLDSLARYWARYEPEKWPDLRSMLDSYFYLDPSNDDSLQETMERVKADCPRAEVDAILADIADVLRLNDKDLEAAYLARLQSYYWPGGDGLTVRQWLTLLQQFLSAPPDASRDHRSGAFK